MIEPQIYAAFENLTEGKSFFLNIDEISELKLLNITAQAGIKFGVMFTCVKHEEKGVYEVSWPTNKLSILNEIPIVKSSTFMQCKNNSPVRLRAKQLPFDELEVGQSFALNLDEVNVPSIRTQCSNNSKNGKQFRCATHKHLNKLEVGRIS